MGIEFIYGLSVDDSFIKVLTDNPRYTFYVKSEDIDSCEFKSYNLSGSEFENLLNVLEINLRNENKFFILEDKEYFEKYIKCFPTGERGVKLTHFENAEIDWFLKYSISYASKKYGLDPKSIIERCEIFNNENLPFNIPYDFINSIRKLNYKSNPSIIDNCFIFQSDLKTVKKNLETFQNTQELENLLFQQNKDKILNEFNKYLENFNSNPSAFVELEKKILDFTVASHYKSSIEGEKIKSLLYSFKKAEQQGQHTNTESKNLISKLEELENEYDSLKLLPHSSQIAILQDKGLYKPVHSFNQVYARPNDKNSFVSQSEDKQYFEITHDISLEDYVSSYKIFIDTCSLLKTDIYRFFDEVKTYLISYDKKIIIPYQCIKELEKHTANNMKPELNEPAKKILDYLENANKENLIDIRGDKNESFADNIFLTVFNKYRLKTNLLLITEDFKLASDINVLKNQKSVESHYEIKTANLKSFYPLYKQLPRYEKDFGEIKSWDYD